MRIANDWTDSPASYQLWSNVGRLVFVMALVLVFMAAARIPVDSDMWWHLRAGEATWTNARPLLHDLFSFTRLGQPWNNHSWLSQVVIYILFRWGGYLALGGAVALLAVGMMVLVFLQQDGPALLRAFLLVLASAVAAVVWTPRPQMASLFFFALTGYILYLYKWRRRDYLWWFIPIFVLWSNLHGGYSLGLLAIGALIAGELINHALGHRSSETLTWNQIGKIALIGILCALVVAINPNGAGAWLIPFQTVGIYTLQNFVSEWASPDFHDPIQQPLLWLLFLLFAAVGLSKRRLDGSDLVTVVLFGMMAFIARRNYGPFALAAAPVLSRHLWGLIDDFTSRYRARKEMCEEAADSEPAGNGDLPVEAVPAWKKTLNLVLVAVLGFVALGKLYVVTHPDFVEQHIQEAYPSGVLDWMQAQRLNGRIMNEYAWGGYLQWNLRQSLVFVDGRTDLFGDEVIGEWITFVQAGEGWRETLARWQIDLVLLEPTRPVVPYLTSDGWVIIYQDGNSVLLSR